MGRADVVYNGKRVVTSIQPYGSGAGRDVSQEAINALRGIVGTVLDAESEGTSSFRPPAGFFDGTPHLATLYEEMEGVLAGTEIAIEGVEHHQWMERYSFRRGGERAVVDVYYNGRGRVTKARPSKASALAAEVQALWGGR